MTQETHTTRSAALDQPAPSALADAMVLDADGTEHRLGDLWAGQTTLLLWIRHFGCIGCSENIGDVAPRLPELQKLGAQVLIIGNGAPQFIEGFASRFGLSYQHLQVLTDPSLKTFQAAGLLRSWWASQGPRALWDALRAFGKGHFQHRSQGDSWQQGGTMVLDEEGVVRFLHRNQSLGGHAEPAAWMDVILQLWLHKHPVAT